MPLKPSWMDWKQLWYGIIYDETSLQWKARATKTLQLLPDASPAGFLACQTPISLKSSPIVWETYFWQLDLQAWSLRKKSFTSFLTLINVCSPLGQNAQRWVPVVIWSIVQISQSKCCHIVGKRTNGANVQESHEKLLWNNAQGWEVLTHVSQEAKCLNKAW